MSDIKIKIVGYDDRAKMLAILAENGYMVTVEKEEVPPAVIKSILDSFIVIKGVD